MNTQKKIIPAVRIFISSPGDVQIERETARSVIDKLRHEYSRFADIQAILWEELPLTTAKTFQEGINAVLRENGVDIAVFILANRLGSCPGNNLRYPDGRLYKSGTEYEYDFMKKLREDSGKPEILVYVRKKELGNFSSQSKEKVIEAFEQLELVNNFISEEFEDKKLGAYKAYHVIDHEVNFESRLTEHLRKLLQKILGSPELPRYEGNPYKGLLAFEPEDAYIFFGRGLQLQLLKSKIIDFYSEKSKIPYVFICGESGSGKSSFAKAGIVQSLLRTGVIESFKCNVKKFTPQHANGKFSEVLLNYLKEMLPALQGNDYFKNLYNAEIISNQDVAIIDAAIKQSGTEKQNFMPVFLIDQFEEFFSDSKIFFKEREKSISLLSALQKTGRIMIIFTLRSDCYHYVTSHEKLLELKNNSIVYDIVPMAASDLQEVIEEPARAAGLTWEKDAKSGEFLNDIVFNEALRLRSLPLLEFALSNLYENRKENLLTCDFYRKSGGMQGAIENYANNIFNSFTAIQKESFFNLLSMSVTLGTDGKFSRYNAVEEEFSLAAKDKEVLEILVRNRLFVRSATPEGKVCFSVAHEFLLHNWQVIVRWCEQEKEFLERMNFAKMQAAKWEKNKKHKCYLLSSYDEIEEAKILLLTCKNRLSKSVKDFLSSSIKVKNQKWKWTITIPCAVAIIFIAICNLAVLFKWSSIINACKLNTDVKDIKLLFLCYYLMLFLFIISKWDGAILYKKMIRTIFYCTIQTIISAIVFISIYRYDFKNSGIWFILSLIFIFNIGVNFIAYKQYKLVEKGKKKKISNVLLVFLNGIIPKICGIFVIVSCLLAVMVSLYSNKPAIQYLDLLQACENNWYGEINQHLIKNYEESLKRRKSSINFSKKDNEMYDFENYMYALNCYKQCMVEEALKYDFGKRLQDDLQRNLYFLIKYELRQIEDNIIDWLYAFSGVPIYEKVYFALLQGDINSAAKLAVNWEPQNFIIASRELLVYAHYLLLVKKDEIGAVKIYKKFLNFNFLPDRSWNDALLIDFAKLKENSSFQQSILNVEKEIAITPLPIPCSCESPVDIKEMPQLCGTWHLENASFILNFPRAFVSLKINPENVIPVYYDILQEFNNKKKLKNRAAFYIKIYKKNDYFLLILYNPRQDSIDIWHLTFMDENTINIEIIFSLEKNTIGKKYKLYKCKNI